MDNYLNYWEEYYQNHRDPGRESPFARFVLPFLREGAIIYELGCGNGRDSIFFEKFGLHITAFDQCEKEIEYLNDKYSSNRLAFEVGDFTQLGNRANSHFIYSRFTLHSVNREQEKNTLDWAFDNLNTNGLFFIEIRSTKDELFGEGDKVGNNEFITDHYRRFVIYDEFVKRIEQAGFNVIYKIESKGLAKYKDEDPVIIRVIAQKNL